MAEHLFVLYAQAIDESSWEAFVVGTDLRVTAATLDEARDAIVSELKKSDDVADTTGYTLTTRRVSVESKTLSTVVTDKSTRVTLSAPLEIDVPTPYIVEGQPVLQPSLVMFVDELGTKAAAADLAETYVREKEELLRRARRDLASPAGDESILAFTDHVVVGSPVGSDPRDFGSQLGLMLTSMAYYQAELIARGQALLRGGVAFGDYYASGYFAHGPALIEAVNIEEQIAVFPRIVLSDDCVRLMVNDLSFYGDPATWTDVPWLNQILVDADGRLFLDYLGSTYGDHVSTGEDGDWVLERHRDVVRNRLAIAPAVPRVRMKLEWLCDYHNAVCRRLRNDPSLMVEHERSFPTYRLFRTILDEPL